jgi:hypothetical protein
MLTTGEPRHGDLRKAFLYENADIAPGLTIAEYRRRNAHSRVTPRWRRLLGRHLRH